MLDASSGAEHNTQKCFILTGLDTVLSTEDRGAEFFRPEFVRGFKASFIHYYKHRALKIQIWRKTTRTVENNSNKVSDIPVEVLFSIDSENEITL